MHRRHDAHDHLGQLCRHVAPVLLADALGERAPEDGVPVQAQQLEKGPVAFGHVAAGVQDHDADGRLVEQPVKAARRTGAGPILQHHRAAVNRLALGTGAPGVGQDGPEDVPVPSLEDGFAVALPARHVFAEHAPPHVRGADAQPSGEGLVGVEYPPIRAGRDKSRRQVIHEVGQHFFLLAADGFHFPARGHVLGPPQRVPPGQRADGDAPPFDGVHGPLDGNLGLGLHAAGGGGDQAAKGIGGVPPDDDAGYGFQGHRELEQPVKGRVGIDEGAVGGGDQARLWIGLGGLKQERGCRRGLPGDSPGRPGQRRQGEQPEGGREQTLGLPQGQNHGGGERRGRDPDGRTPQKGRHG